MVRQFMVSIPDELIEAARIDGASELGIFFKVVVPLSRPIIAVLIIFTAMWRWNDFALPLVILTRQDMFRTSPPDATDAVSRCSQHRCFPVLAGPSGTQDILLISPIILYDHPEVAEQSDTALYDCTEIDEILTLRVMTMTDEEKAQAWATDPRAASTNRPHPWRRRLPSRRRRWP